ncbi:MAG: hypothetical protein VX915_03505 [Pseudomonadota bacterium]|nr:hypothetical protein [Pseudomonadota bacterium]
MKNLIFPIMLSHVPLGALAELVDLSAASAQEIAKSLHRIRRSESHNIIEYRIRFSPIDTPEDSLVVKGIGEKHWKRIVRR